MTADIVERWTFSLALDMYKKDAVAVGLEARLRKNCVLGFGAHSKVSASVVGPHCVIGNNGVVRNSHLFGDCVVGDNAHLDGAVLANHVRVGSPCRASKGCILSFGVEVTDGVRLAKHTNISRTRRDPSTPTTSSDLMTRNWIMSLKMSADFNRSKAECGCTRAIAETSASSPSTLMTRTTDT